MTTLIRGGLAAATALTLVVAGAAAGLAHESLGGIDSMPSAAVASGSQDPDAADRNADQQAELAQEQAAEAAKELAEKTTQPVPGVVMMDEEANETAEDADLEDGATEVKGAPGAVGAAAAKRQNESAREEAERQNEAAREAAGHQNEVAPKSVGGSSSQSGHDDGHHGGNDSRGGSGRH